MSVSCAVAYGLWVISVGFMVASWFTEGDAFGRMSLLTSAAAVTASIRTYFVGLGVRIKAALIVAATESPASVSSIR